MLISNEEWLDMSSKKDCQFERQKRWSRSTWMRLLVQPDGRHLIRPIRTFAQPRTNCDARLVHRSESFRAHPTVREESKSHSLTIWIWIGFIPSLLASNMTCKSYKQGLPTKNRLVDCSSGRVVPLVLTVALLIKMQRIVVRLTDQIHEC